MRGGRALLPLSAPARRYYGQSKPYQRHQLDRLQYLTSEQAGCRPSRAATAAPGKYRACAQALADYAELLMDLKAGLRAEDSAVISFGGRQASRPRLELQCRPAMPLLA